MNICSIGELKSDAPVCSIGNIKSVIPHQSVGQTKSHSFELLRKYRLFKSKRARDLDYLFDKRSGRERQDELDAHDAFKADRTFTDRTINPSLRARHEAEQEQEYDPEGDSFGTVEQLGRGQPNMSRQLNLKRSYIL